jgi:hypothetical protein
LESLLPTMLSIMRFLRPKTESRGGNIRHDLRASQPATANSPLRD